MQNPAPAERLRAANETLAQSRAAYTAISDRLGAADWDEAKDAAALDAAKLAYRSAELAVSRLTEDMATRALFPNPDAGVAPGVSVTAPATLDKYGRGDSPHVVARQFSLMRAIRIKYGIRSDAGMEKMDGLEAEMIQEGELEARSAELSEFDPNGFMVPQMVAYRSHRGAGEVQKRDMTVGTTTAGGFLVSTDNRELIGFLDPNTPLVQLGARVLTGLRGNITFPRQTARATGYPLAEQTAITESQQTLAQLSLSPKRQGAYTEFSLQLLRQADAPGVEQLLRDDLMVVLSTIQEQYAIQGTGSGNQPTGITATSGIGSVAGGTNGLIPTFGNIVGLETEVAVDNALRGKLGYLTTPQVAGVLKQVKRDVAGNGFIMEGSNGMGMNMVNGYKAATSTLVPSTLTKGTASGICHAIIFGNFEELIMAYWGGVEIVLDPYSLATTGSYRITANAFMDVGVRRAQSFAAMLDALIA